VQELRDQKKYILTYSDWPTMSAFDNGLPRFSEYPFNPAPTDYKGAFGRNHDWQIDNTQLSGFQDLLQYARSDESLVKHFTWPGQPGPDQFFDFTICMFVERLIDRYIHLFPNEAPDDDRFAQIYRPLEACIYEKDLLVDIVIPILFLKFDFDKHILAPNAVIEKMSDEFQLARISKRAYSPSVNTIVLGAATHALVLKGWSINNSGNWSLSSNFSELSFYQKPLDLVDAFFGSLRIAGALDAGYAQVLVRPLNWALHYVAHLPPVEGTSLRRYPYWFENYYWNQPVTVVPDEKIIACSTLYLKLIEVENNRLRIALKRLNGCYLREGEEDSVLDATIAMEALLSDDERQEMTHKLALRIAALSSLTNFRAETPIQVFKAVKQIYAYRSKIVHGSTKTHKGREIAITPTQKIPTVQLAIDYLRMLITILIDHPEYLRPARIDEDLLLDGRSRLDTERH